MLMNKILRYSFVALMAMIFGNVMANDITDELTLTTFGVTGTSYTDVSNKSATSSAIYSANMAGGNNAIQLRSNNNNSGIISTTSGGKIKSIKIEWNSNTADARVLKVYGSSTAYSSPADLYGDNKGTEIASFTKSDGTKTETITGDYQYIGFRSNSGAMYIDKITIVWEAEGVVVATPTISGTTPFVGSTEVTITNNEDGAKVYYTTDGTEPTSNSLEYTAHFTITETTTVKAIAVKGGTSSSVASATYTKVSVISIAEAQTKDKGTTVVIEGVVVASAAGGAVLYDGTDYMYYYNNSNALNVGQKVRMAGALGEYGGAKQMPNNATITELGTETVTYPTPTTLTKADFEAIVTAKKAERKYVTFEGTLTISGNYFNILIDSEVAQGSLVKPKEDLSALNNQKVTVNGFMMYVNNKYVYAVATEVKLATNINTIKANTDVNAPVYNIAGQQVEKSYKGLVIKNGKKVINK